VGDPELVPEDRVARVMGDPDLLGAILAACLCERALGRAARVCAGWRAVAGADGVWEPLTRKKVRTQRNGVSCRTLTHAAHAIGLARVQTRHGARPLSIGLTISSRLQYLSPERQHFLFDAVFRFVVFRVRHASNGCNTPPKFKQERARGRCRSAASLRASSALTRWRRSTPSATPRSTRGGSGMHSSNLAFTRDSFVHSGIAH